MSFLHLKTSESAVRGSWFFILKGWEGSSWCIAVYPSNATWSSSWLPWETRQCTFCSSSCEIRIVNVVCRRRLQRSGSRGFAPIGTVHDVNPVWTVPSKPSPKSIKPKTSMTDWTTNSPRATRWYFTESIIHELSERLNNRFRRTFASFGVRWVNSLLLWIRLLTTRPSCHLSCQVTFSCSSYQSWFLFNFYWNYFI